MSKDVRKALMIAKGQVSSGYLPPGDPQREANLARYMKGANKQVFNKDKSPKTFYHGTTVPEDFSEFSVGNPIHTEDEYGESHRRIYTHNDPTTYLGSHFAEEPEIANKFGKGLYGEAKGAQEGNRVLPVHLSIKKPHVTTETDMIRSMLRDTYDHPAVSARLQNEEEEKRYDDPKEIDFRTRVNKFAWKLSSDESAYDNDTFAEQMAKQYRNRLINAGFDGIKYQNEVEGGNSWVAFHPTQIKSAIGNNGQYDPNEPEMNKAEGGEILPPGHPEREANLARHMEGSKAPKELYHLSKGPIPETFDSKLAAHSNRENLSPFGFHFGTKEQAAFRGNQDDFSPYVKQGPSTGKFHVSIRKPFKTTHMGSTYVDHLADTMMDANLIKPEEYDEMRAKAFDDSEIAPELKGVLKRKGYDGLVYKNEREGEGLSWVPFSGTQIKSATGNTGTFDPSDPDITKAEGGKVKSRHPALSIPGFHVREEIHGTPIFTGGRNAN